MSLRSAKYVSNDKKAHVKEPNKEHDKGHAEEINRSHGQDHGQDHGQQARKEAHQSGESHRSNTEDGAQVIHMTMLLG
jgi:hypothetical protein